MLWRSRDRVAEDEQPVVSEGGASAVLPTPEPAPSGRLVRSGELVNLRVHIPDGRAAFQRWYADPEIAVLLRHDQEPLSLENSRSYFDTIILPSSAQGLCFAIHEAATDILIGTTALTDLEGNPARRSFFRIVIGEKAFWGGGRGTEATDLMMAYAFTTVNLELVRLEVFQHNPRAIAAYRRVGFEATGSHVEWVGPDRRELHVVEMSLPRERWEQARAAKGT
jgi:RimJ/RimL family protein N-acetyltransferase